MVALSMAACGNTAENDSSSAETSETTISTTTTDATTTAAFTDTTNSTVFSHEPEGKYVYADHETYKTPAEENGLGNTKAYTYGKNFDYFVSDGVHFMTFDSDDGSNWLTGLSLFLGAEKEIGNKLKNCESAVIYEVYQGFSEVYKRPALMAEKIVIDGVGYDTGIDSDSFLDKSDSTTDTTTTTTETTAKLQTTTKKKTTTAKPKTTTTTTTTAETTTTTVQTQDPYSVCLTLYVNDNTMKVHHSGCRYHDAEGCHEEYTTVNDLISRGYQPCKICKPW